MIVVLAIIGMIFVAILASTEPSQGIDSYVPESATGSNFEFTVTVTEVAFLTDSDYYRPDVRPMFAPDDGNKYIMLTIEQTCLGDDTLSSPDLYWELRTSDGRVHDYAVLMRNDDTPDGIQAGATVTYHIAFEVAEYANPTALAWDEWPSYLSFSIDLSE